MQYSCPQRQFWATYGFAVPHYTIMSSTLAGSERWQKDLKKQKITKKIQIKKTLQKTKNRKKKHTMFFLFFLVFRNVPWTQDLTTVSQKNRKKTTKKKNKKNTSKNKKQKQKKTYHVFFVFFGFSEMCLGLRI